MEPTAAAPRKLTDDTPFAARLARIVANPMHALSFKKEKDTNFRDTVVSLLIDSSGSMRGRSIIIAAMCADILGRTLAPRLGEALGRLAHRAQGTPVEARLPDSTPLVRNDQLVDFQAQTEPSE